MKELPFVLWMLIWAMSIYAIIGIGIIIAYAVVDFKRYLKNNEKNEDDE